MTPRKRFVPGAGCDPQQGTPASRWRALVLARAAKIARRYPRVCRPALVAHCGGGVSACACRCEARAELRE